MSEKFETDLRLEKPGNKTIQPQTIEKYETGPRLIKQKTKQIEAE